MSPTDSGPDAGSPARRASLAVVVVAGLVLVVAAAVLVPWRWLPGGGALTVLPARDFFSSRELAAMTDYADAQRPISLAAYALQLVVACVLGLTPLGSRAVDRLPRRWWVRTALAVPLLLAAAWVLVLPLRAWLRSNAVDIGLATGSWAAWLRDQALSLGVSVVGTAVPLLGLVALARLRPRSWPAWGGALAAVSVVLVSFAWPVVVEPLFNRFTPLPDGPLRQEVLRLAEAEGVPVADVLVADASRRTTAYNAYVSGLGSTRRVVFYDTTVEELPRAQATVIAAHELAHARHHDVALGTGLGAAGAALGAGLLGLLLERRRLLARVGATGPADPRVVPLVLALVAIGALVSAPVQNTVSRAMEARADRTSLEFTGATDALVDLQRSLALRARHDPEPPTLLQVWFGTHPTTMQRISLAEALRGDAR